MEYQYLEVDQSVNAKSMRRLNEMRKSKQPPAVRRLFFSQNETSQDAMRKSPRTFFYKISGLSVSFEKPVGNPFLNVEVGGRFVETQTDTPAPLKKKKRKKKEKSKSNENNQVEDVDDEIQVVVVDNDIGDPNNPQDVEIVYRKTAKLYGHRNIHYTMCKRRVSAKEEASFDAFFSGYWTGSYEDLMKEDIRIEAWDRELIGGNTLIAGCAVRLRSIVDSSVSQEFELFKSYPASSNGEVMCRVKMSILFEEKCDYVIDLRRWDVRLEDGAVAFKNPAITFTSRRKDFTSQFTLGIRKLFTIFHSFPFDGHIPALLTPLSFLMPFKLLPRLSQLSHLFDHPISSATLAASSQNHTANQSRFLPYHNSLRYRGTRSQLEEEQIKVVLSEERSNRRRVSTTALYDGVLDYGFLRVDMEENECKIRVQGSINLRPSLPQYRQYGRFELPQKNIGIISSLLCCCIPGLESSQRSRMGSFDIRIVRARGLYSLVGYRESLSPSVSVEWNQQQRSTDIVEGTSEPFWGQTMSFNIPLDEEGFVLKRVGQTALLFKCWDNDSLGKDPLGFAKIDFLQVLNGATNSDGSLFLFQKTFDLHIPEFYQKTGKKSPTLQVEISFNNEFALGEIQNLLGNSKDLSEEPAHYDEASDAEFARAAEAWIDVQSNLHRLVPEGTERYFQYQGLDETSGNPVFLPRILGDIYPPAGLSIVSNANQDSDPSDDFMYFVHNIEYRRSSIPSSSSLVNEDNEENVDFDIKRPPVERWMDPYTFLERRSGDFKEHAVLLCNLMMSLNLDVYVVIGSAQYTSSSNAKNVTEHYWVMTRELDGTVKFWEASNLKVYTLESMNALKRWRRIERTESEDPCVYEESKVSVISEEGPLRIDERSYVKTKVIPKYSVFDQKKASRDNFKEAFDSEDEHRMNMLHLDGFSESIPADDFPYISVDVIFNKDNLYANLQEANPLSIDYTLEDETRWFRFPYKKTFDSPYYEVQTLRGLAPRQLILNLQEEIMQSIVVAIQQYREGFNVQYTNFFPDDELQLIHKRLALEEFLSRIEVCQSSKTEIEKERRLSVIERMDTSFTQKLSSKLLEGYTYSEKRLRFKHTNSSRIADIIVSALKTNLLNIPEKNDPHFVVAARIERLPSFVTTTRVLVGVVYRER